jgi:GH25 family lysozyme M1 (1,4-beta-N-acetylmuramidase)
MLHIISAEPQLSYFIYLNGAANLFIGGQMFSFRFLAPLLFVTACVVTPEEEIEIASTEEGLTVCPSGPTTLGIDVSYYQENINWNSVKNAGVKWAIIRVSDGSTFVDPKFQQNWSGAKNAGVIRGAYQFFRPNQDPIAQANLLLNTMGPLEPGDLPPVIDVEATGGLSPATVAARVGQWIQRVESVTGRKPIIYTGKYFWQDNVQSAAFSSYPLWHAQYTTATCANIADQWSTWTMWQYTDSGTVAGVPGPVDTNRFNGDLAALQAFANGGAPAPVCGDGVCSAGETEASCAADCGQPSGACAAIAASGGSIDESDDCFIPGGPAQYLRSVTNDGNGGDLIWTGTTTQPVAANFGQWDLNFAEAGTYRVEVFVDTSYATATKARYRITHGGDTDYVTLNQKSANGFRTLGEFRFAAGGNQKIFLADNTGEANTKIVFDTVRFTRVQTGGCGNDICSNGETQNTCQTDCQPCALVETTTEVINDGDACFVAGGPAEYLRSVSDDGFDGDLIWTGSTTSTSEFNFADWNLFFAEFGRYKVEVYTDISYAQTTKAKYKITHNGVTDTVTLNQKSTNGWRSLGEFNFAAGGSQKIHLGDSTGESNLRIVFDAVRITKVIPAGLVEATEKEEGLDGEFDNTVGSCSVDTSSSNNTSALFLLAFTLLGLVIIRNPRNKFLGQ